MQVLVEIQLPSYRGSVYRAMFEPYTGESSVLKWDSMIPSGELTATEEGDSRIHTLPFAGEGQHWGVLLVILPLCILTPYHALNITENDA